MCWAGILFSPPHVFQGWNPFFLPCISSSTTQGRRQGVWLGGGRGQNASMLRRQASPENLTERVAQQGRRGGGGGGGYSTMTYCLYLSFAWRKKKTNTKENNHRSLSLTRIIQFSSSVALLARTSFLFYIAWGGAVSNSPPPPMNKSFINAYAHEWMFNRRSWLLPYFGKRMQVTYYLNLSYWCFCIVPSVLFLQAKSYA